MKGIQVFENGKLVYETPENEKPQLTREQVTEGLAQLYAQQLHKERDGREKLISRDEAWELFIAEIKGYVPRSTSWELIEDFANVSILELARVRADAAVENLLWAKRTTEAASPGETACKRSGDPHNTQCADQSARSADSLVPDNYHHPMTSQPAE